MAYFFSKNLEHNTIMKSYIQGLITGSVFVFAFFVFVGADNKDDEVGRYTFHTEKIKAGFEIDGEKWRVTIFDTKTGESYSRKVNPNTDKIEGLSFHYLKYYYTEDLKKDKNK